METTQRRYNWVTLISLLLSLPAAYIIFISILKYGLNIDGPFDTSVPFLERMGIMEPLGWNINLLILMGPLLALAISVMQVLGIEWQFTKEAFQFRIVIQKRWFPIAVALFSGLVLATLFIYLVGENCHNI